MRCLPLLVVLVFLPTALWAGECEDGYSECQEDCLIQFGGSIRVEMKAKFVKCIKKCTKKSATCRERFNETKVNRLNEGALDRSPTSRDVDEFGMPIVKTPKPKKRREVKDDEVVTADRAARATEPPAPPVAKKAPEPIDSPKPAPAPPPSAQKKDDDDDLRNY